MTAGVAGRFLLVILALPLALVIAACASSGITPDPDPVASRFGVHVTGAGTTMQEVLPSELTDDASWGLKQGVASKDGYDLRPFAGKTVELVKYPLRERYGPHRLDMWLVASDGKVVGAYAAVRPESSLAPGIFSLSEIGSSR